jgi:hypothetical protein
VVEVDVVVVVLLVVVVGGCDVVVVVVEVVLVVDVLVLVVDVDVVVVDKAHVTDKYTGSVQIPNGTTLIVVVKSGTVTLRPGVNKAPKGIFVEIGLV